MTGSNTWYIRRRGEVKGPYPAGLVSRYILLGRLQMTDEVSASGQDWLPVQDVPDLIPKILQGDISDPVIHEDNRLHFRRPNTAHEILRCIFYAHEICTMTDAKTTNCLVQSLPKDKG